MDLTVRKRGYRDYAATVVPGADRDVESRLERIRIQELPDSDTTPQPTLQPVPRLPRIEPNYGQEKNR
jgi:hypothetical protein